MRSSLRACFSTRCPLPTLHAASLLPGAPSPLVSVQFTPGSAPELYPSSWLWANAPAHHDPGTNQRTLSALALSSPPPLESLSLCPTALTVHWGGGLRTTYPAPYLHSQRLSPASLAGDQLAARPAVLPSSKADVPAFAHASLLGSPASALGVLRALNACGIALVHGCPTGQAGAVTALASTLAPVMPTIYGESFEVSVQAQPINVAYTAAALELHQDLAYYESPPGLQLLLCQEFSAGVQGGESTFACGLAAAEALRAEHPGAFATLCSVPTTFQKVHYARASPVHMVTARPIISLARQWGGQGEVTAVFWAPPFEGPLRVPLADVQPYYAAYAAFAGLLADIERGARPGLLQFRLAPGEAVIFNQRRLLHGRRAFAASSAGSAVSRVLQGCYIHADEWVSRLRALGQDALQQGQVRHARTGNQQLLC
jgi:alpha-ketoglutarate-dependent taurine dioxygenase